MVNFVRVSIYNSEDIKTNPFKSVIRLRIVYELSLITSFLNVITVQSQAILDRKSTVIHDF